MSVDDKNEAPTSTIASEQLVLLLISGLFVLFGQSLIAVLDETMHWQAYGISAVGMLFFLLTALSFNRREFPTWF